MGLKTKTKTTKYPFSSQYTSSSINLYLNCTTASNRRSRSMLSIRRLSKKTKAADAAQTREALLREPAARSPPPSASKSVPAGFFAVYVGDEKERFVVPTSFLSHPLFKMLLEKAYDEFGFEQKSGLVVPCSVSAFQEVVDAVEGSHGRFDITKLFQEFL